MFYQLSVFMWEKTSEVGRIHPISDFMDRVFTIFHELAENVGMISGGSLKVPNCVLFIRKTITHRVK